jgi:hypothetical protein
MTIFVNTAVILRRQHKATHTNNLHNMNKKSVLSFLICCMQMDRQGKANSSSFATFSCKCHFILRKYLL